MIVVGYQGIGKSTLAGKHNCIDLESGNFWVNGERSSDWYRAYCQIAIHLSEQGYTVFTSSHQVVREQLENCTEKVVVIFPSINLKDEWLSKLEDRWNATKLDKDFKAFANARERYMENIVELMCGNLATYEITSMDYSLEDIVNQLKDM